MWLLFCSHKISTSLSVFSHFAACRRVVQWRHIVAASWIMFHLLHGSAVAIQRNNLSAAAWVEVLKRINCCSRNKLKLERHVISLTEKGLVCSQQPSCLLLRLVPPVTSIVHQSPLGSCLGMGHGQYFLPMLVFGIDHARARVRFGFYASFVRFFCDVKKSTITWTFLWLSTHFQKYLWTIRSSRSKRKNVLLSPVVSLRHFQLGRFAVKSAVGDVANKHWSFQSIWVMCGNTIRHGTSK